MHLYDSVPYHGRAIPAAHPDRLATLATLFGVTTAPVTSCRVLDVGCGDARGLVAMASALPESTFVGFDIAARPIEEARERAERLGCGNVTLFCLDLLEVPEDFGSFDYIIAHGLLSWVPAPVRERLMALLKRHLAPGGVAYVSHNAYPGGHLRRMTREMMRFHVRGIDEPARRVEQARALLHFLVEAQDGEGYYRHLLEKERELCHAYTAEHFFHDHLADVNEPFYLYEFVELAGRHGLRYLTEATFAATRDEHFPAETVRVLRGLDHDPVLKQQYLDFLRGRMFRQTLVCHADVPVAPAPLLPSVATLCAAAPVRAAEEEPGTGAVRFTSFEGRSIRTGHPLTRAVCEALGERWPCPATWEELEAAARRAGIEPDGPDEDPYRLAQVLLGFYGDQFVELHAHVPPLDAGGADRPLATPAARVEAEEGDVVTNLWHHPVTLTDALTRRLLRQLDGTRDRSALLELLRRPAAGGSVRSGVMPADVDGALDRLAREGLLVAA